MHSLKFCEQQAAACVVGEVGALGVVGAAGAVGVARAVGVASVVGGAGVVGVVGAAGAIGAVGAVGDVGRVGGSTTWFRGDNVTGAEVGRGDTGGVGSRMVTAGGR